jgi:hypothetical protein
LGVSLGAAGGAGIGDEGDEIAAVAGIAHRTFDAMKPATINERMPRLRNTKSIFVEMKTLLEVFRKTISSSAGAISSTTRSSHHPGSTSMPEIL